MLSTLGVGASERASHAGPLLAAAHLDCCAISLAWLPEVNLGVPDTMHRLTLSSSVSWPFLERSGGGFGGSALQRLEPGVGLVASGWRPVATSGEVSEVGAEGSTTTTEEPGVHLFRLGLRCGRDRNRGRYLPGRCLGPRHGRRGLWWHEGGTSPSFLIVQFAELSTRGAPLSRLRSIPGLRESGRGPGSKGSLRVSGRTFSLPGGATPAKLC